MELVSFASRTEIEHKGNCREERCQARHRSDDNPAASYRSSARVERKMMTTRWHTPRNMGHGIRHERIAKNGQFRDEIFDDFSAAAQQVIGLYKAT